MLRIIIVLVTIFLIAHSASAQDWLTDIDSAKSLATEEDKAVLLVFQGSDWCGPCIKLHKEVWETSAFARFSEEHLIPVKVDFPRRKKNALSPEQVAHNESLAETYNPNGIFPFVVLIDASGNLLGETGYKNIELDAYLDHLNSFIQ